jgi:oligopeptide/dipeptide ABC transporter ATP-binding protein
MTAQNPQVTGTDTGRLSGQTHPSDPVPMVEVRDLKISFRARGSRRDRASRVQAVAGVSLSIRRGDVLGLVGESGSGKTTLGQAIVGLVRPDEGSILVEGVDVSRGGRELSQDMRRKMQIVFQESRGSLNPRMRVEDVIGEGLAIQGVPRRERADRVGIIAAKVGLAKGQLRRYPHEFSGGQRQRIGIARALAVEPEFLVADEPVAALDVSVQAQVLNLLSDLREEFQLTYLFISHDLGVVERISSHVAVMYMGHLIEYAEVAKVYAEPQVPYTYALLSARPAIEQGKRYRRIVLKGDITNAHGEEAGCPFRSRCWMAQDLCRTIAPPLAEVRPGHWAACHFPGQFEAPAATTSSTLAPGSTRAALRATFNE